MSPTASPADSHATEGTRRLAAGDVAGSIAALSAATRRDPGCVPAWNNLAIALGRARRHPESLEAAERAAALDGGHPDVLVTLANALVMAGREAEAAQVSARAVAAAPGDAGIAAAHARTLARADRLEEALVRFDALLGGPADGADLRHTRALTLLKLGRWRDGWAAYEARWDLPTYRAWRSRWPNLPAWDGESPRGRTIVVRHEQGAGDTIMAVRWLPRLADAGARVVAHVPRALVPLLSGQFAGVDVVATDAPVTGDAIVGMLSLPHRLGLTSPFGDGGAYLRAPLGGSARALRAALDRVIGPGALPVGLAWAGTPDHAYDHLRSVPLATFAPLLADPALHPVSLQVGAAATEWATVAAGRGTDAAPWLADYAATATVVARCGLVCAVDTSVAHLAGALGRPVQLFLPTCADWRWGRPGDDRPWYAGLRAIRRGAAPPA